MRVALIAAACAGHFGCFAGALPPSRTDVGVTAAGARVTTGAHYASGTLDEDVGFDVGAGYVFELRGSAGDSAPTAYALDAPARTPAHTLHGGYVEAARRLHRDRARRSWLGMRAEALYADTGDTWELAGYGASARLAVELFGAGRAAGSGTDRCGLYVGGAYGATGIGVFLESGVRHMTAGDTAFTATVGLTVRLPLIAGMVISTCVC